MPRSVRPRDPSQYNNAAHGGREGGGPGDDRTINTTLCRSTLVRPRFNEGPMMFRPWPALNYANPSQLVSGRETLEANGQGPWIVHTTVASFIGVPENPNCERSTFILYAPWAPKSERFENPYKVLYYTAKKAHKAGRFGETGVRWDVDWNPLMVGGKGEGAPLSSPTQKWFVQGEIYANGDRQYINTERKRPLGAMAEDSLTVIQLPESGGARLLQLLDTPSKSPQGDDAAPHLDFLFGDPTGVYNPANDSLTGGLIVTIFNPAKTPNPKFSSWDGNPRQFPGFEAAVSQAYRAAAVPTPFKAQFLPEDIARVKEKWQFWWDSGDDKGLLHIPSTEEQCVYIAKAFSIFPNLLKFCWGDHPEFLSAEVNAILSAKNTVAMGNAQAPQAQAPAASGGMSAPPPRRARTDPGQPPAPSAETFDNFDAPGDAPGEATTGSEFESPAADAPTEEFGQLPSEFNEIDTGVVDTGLDEGFGEGPEADAGGFEDEGDTAGLIPTEPESEFEESPVAPSGDLSAVSKEMENSMRLARERSLKRGSVQVQAPPPANPPAPPPPPLPTRQAPPPPPVVRKFWTVLPNETTPKEVTNADISALIAAGVDPAVLDVVLVGETEWKKASDYGFKSAMPAAAPRASGLPPAAGTPATRKTGGAPPAVSAPAASAPPAGAPRKRNTTPRK